MKKAPIGLMSILIILMLTLASCTAETTATPQTDVAPADSQAVEVQASDTQTTDVLPVFTLEELSKYNGKEGNAAYVGYEGNVYDVTDIKAWKNGIHQGKYEAGQDLTDVLNNLAPHSPSNLTDNAPLVGTLEQN